jgi:2-methylcitrate dehydratase PrpD
MSYNSHQITTDITKTLARYIRGAKFEDFPPAIVERVKLMLLHTIGAALCGTALWQYRDAVAIAKESSAGGGTEGATLWGDGKKVSAEAAAFVAGLLSDLLDWEDCSWGGHPSAGVIPASVIGAEIYKKNGKELITAAILGYEIYQRSSRAAPGNIVGNNSFAAIVPLVKYLDLDEGEINRAFGIATACAILPVNCHEETMSDALNYLYGLRAESAFLQAKTALYGIENMEDALDDPTAFTAHMRSQNPEFFTKDLGVEYCLTDILIKHWPANMYVQTYAELADRLRRKYGFAPDDIEEILIDPAVESRYWFSETGFLSLTHAQFSIPYVISAVLHHPEPGSIWYEEKTLTNPNVVALMNKVRAVSFIKNAPGHLYHLIKGCHPRKFMTVRLKNGAEYRDGIFTHPGHPSYMLTREEFEERFRIMTKNALSPEKTERIIDFLSDLENQPDASLLAGYLY